MPRNAGKPWTALDRNVLQDLYNNHKSTSHMAEFLGRSEYAIEGQLENMTKQPIRQMAKPTEKKNIMHTNNKVTIKVFVGNREAKNLSTEDLLLAIEQEEMFIKRLAALTVKSVKIKKLISRHTRNITKLMDLI